MQNNYTKQQLRAYIQAMRQSIPAEVRAAAEHEIMVRLGKLPEFVAAKSILAYHGSAALGEIQTHAILQKVLESGKLLALPRVAGAIKSGLLSLHHVLDLQTLVRSKWGILEPEQEADEITLQDVELIIVPGTAFDRNGARLGAGGGFYDRLLAGTVYPTTVALAFDCQLVDAVPRQEHDVAIDIIITESQTIDCRK
jgi:5-formyltetrahydrofolate cyclo-ligase